MDLPLEIKHMICAMTLDGGEKTLRELSLVNHAWYQATVPFLYERLQICLTTTEKLEEDIKQLFENPLRRQYLRHLRRLDIVGLSGKASLKLSSLHKAVEGPDMLDDFLDRDLWQQHTFRMCRRNPGLPDSAPLVRLIAAVSSLKEVNYVRALRFPLTILSAIHQYHPACKLNMVYFYLMSWRDPDHSIWDMPLVTSPCLHSIRCYFYGQTPADSVVEPSILKTLSLAPNLQNVDIVLVPRAGFTDRREFAFKPPEGEPTSMARLSTLSFSLNTKMTACRFNQWRQTIDISYLRAWSIGRIDEPDLPRTIHVIAPSFERLERLSLNLWVPIENSQEYWSAVGGMMKALPPLKALWLVGHRNATFLNEVLARHGATLQSLGLDPRNINETPLAQKMKGAYYTAQEIACFAKKCPVLRELHLTVKRRQGRAPETRIYKALGLFPGLVSLCINLDCILAQCAHDAHDDDDYDDDDGNDHTSALVLAHLFRPGVTVWLIYKLRQILTNSAIDSQLAESIFHTILLAQPTRRLETLRLIPAYDKEPFFYAGEIGYWLRRLLNSWLVTRIGCHDSSALHVEKLVHDPKLFQIPYRKIRRCAPWGFFTQLTQWIWPTLNSKFQGWHSLPLQDTE